MDYIIFVSGAAFFGLGFILLLLLLYFKKKLTAPFVFMGIGVVLCFIGLIIAEPLTEEAFPNQTSTLDIRR
ncbi:hypothetical protein HNR44_000955 [Geomicrobium halophilum]|uniref:Uncharacterized protein n=1 Tax=Geomicrobium halophilum TaxID=549000 RepID=A0A841PP80_9BACL|nr:hypothetical protein [Geomicrobium halophilum]MBB6449006.1 hypothetical protein [Geomicrobium halophilum]